MFAGQPEPVTGRFVPAWTVGAASIAATAAAAALTVEEPRSRATPPPTAGSRFTPSARTVKLPPGMSPVAGCSLMVMVAMSDSTPWSTGSSVVSTGPVRAASAGCTSGITLVNAVFTSGPVVVATAFVTVATTGFRSTPMLRPARVMSVATVGTGVAVPANCASEPLTVTSPDTSGVPVSGTVRSTPTVIVTWRASSVDFRIVETLPFRLFGCVPVSAEVIPCWMAEIVVAESTGVFAGSVLRFAPAPVSTRILARSTETVPVLRSTRTEPVVFSTGVCSTCVVTVCPTVSSPAIETVPPVAVKAATSGTSGIALIVLTIVVVRAVSAPPGPARLLTGVTVPWIAEARVPESPATRLLCRSRFRSAMRYSDVTVPAFDSARDARAPMPMEAWSRTASVSPATASWSKRSVSSRVPGFTLPSMAPVSTAPPEVIVPEEAIDWVCVGEELKLCAAPRSPSRSRPGVVPSVSSGTLRVPTSMLSASSSPTFSPPSSEPGAAGLLVSV